METLRYRYGWPSLAVVLAWPALCLGQYAYQQLPTGAGQGVRSDGAIANPNFFQRIADDFILTSPALVTGVEWWGGSENFSSPGLSNVIGFTISIYANGPNGIPVEPPISTQMVPISAVVRAATCDDFLLGGYEFHMSAQLSTPVAIPSGVKHWIHIGALLQSFNLDSMLWSESNTGNNQYSADSAPNDGIWQGPVASPLGDFAFRLRTGLTPPCNSADANCDGSFTAADVSSFVNAMLGVGTPCSPCAGDVDDNGVTNGQDIQAYTCAAIRSL